jgi:hypothetical protein
MEGHLLREMEGLLRALEEHLRHEKEDRERWHMEWDDPRAAVSAHNTRVDDPFEGSPEYRAYAKSESSTSTTSSA